MKVPEHIKVDLALRRAKRFEFDPYRARIVAVILAILVAVAIMWGLVLAAFSSTSINIHGCMTVM